MSDYALARKSRNTLSSFIHIILNLALGVGSIFAVYATKTWIPGAILVLVSKWRVFAVRPRFWLLNIKSSLVDLIASLSFVFLAYCSGPTLLPVHFILAVGYSLWLIALKPRTTTLATEAQALISIFLGSAAITLMSASSNEIFMTLACFIIGYGAARHVLVQTDDKNVALPTIATGLVFAEIAWISHSWLIVYSFVRTGIILPQLSIILSVIAFAIGSCYKSTLKNKGKLKFSDAAMPIIFALLIVIIVIIWFSQPKFNI